MKRTIVVVLFSGLLTGVFGQSEYVIKDFSDRFYARVTISKEGSGTVTILRTKDNVSILKVDGDQLDIGDKAVVGQKRAYKDQTILVYEDFNFDGEKDLAIQEFFSSKGPSYIVYLFRENTFRKDDEFTGIIQESQGSFKLDPASRTISITSSGGCCFHSSGTYVVKDGKPYPVKEASEEINPPFTTVITRVWKDGKKTETVDKTLGLDDDPIMSFDLAGNKKKVMLFTIGDQTLNYALVKANDKVEFNFPASSVYKNPDFTLSPSGNELVFKNASAEYRIYQKVNAGRIEAVGIKVKAGGKEFDLKGDIKTLKGSLKDIPEVDNLVK